MTASEKINEIEQKFASISTWEDRYKEIISMGKKMPEMDESKKIDTFKLKGCQSQVWLFPSVENGTVIFEADSDASIVKGIISILVYVYSGLTPDEILETKPNFLETIGLREHLSMSRANGLSSMLKQISMYAVAFKAKISMGG